MSAEGLTSLLATYSTMNDVRRVPSGPQNATMGSTTRRRHRFSTIHVLENRLPCDRLT